MIKRLVVTYMAAIFLLGALPAGADEALSRQHLLAIKKGRSLAAEGDLVIDLDSAGKTNSIFTTAFLSQVQDKFAGAATDLLATPRASQLVALTMAAISKRDLSELRAVIRKFLELEQAR